MPNFSALPDIYDAATNLGRWRRALDGLADDLGAHAIALKIRQPKSRQADLDMLSSRYLAFSRTASGLYYGLRFSRLQNADWDFLSRQPVHAPVADERLPIDVNELDARKDYAFLRRRIGVRRRLGVRLNPDKVWFDAVSIAFDQDVHSIPPAALADLRPYLVHLTKAVELSRMFRALKTRYNAVLQALDHVHVGLAVALPSGEIIVENNEATRIFERRDGLWKGSDGHLQSQNSEAVTALRAAVREAAQTSIGQSEQAEWHDAVERRSVDTPLLVDIAPLSDSNGEIESGLNGALITVIDPERLPKINLNRIAKLYGLTTAEADVCALMLEGCTAAEIAERRNTSPITAKNQAASILAKVGVSRRIELVRMVLRVLPPIA